ncbi:hypothetical protein EZV62_016683 [Acer yangbiense]|uniref:Leucine-rich repeat-containing N-terminal plant-type domain-containing protein n=1 Tax=Acer yangbiense TaxID=1000413 RepID=A0A5C7HPU7_9ROSI|nr:hypothetical protein EZV62_016683 [Acer yangbiense]
MAIIDIHSSSSSILRGSNRISCGGIEAPIAVDCDMAGRVIGLDLSEESISGGMDNSTGLFALQHLWRLNLAFNYFNETQIPSRLANLTNLTYLNLSNACFGGQIPIEISSLTSLVTLGLSGDAFCVLPLEIQDLKALVQNLSELRYTNLSGTLPHSIGNLKSLSTLDLGGCNFSGPLPTSMGRLCGPPLTKSCTNSSEPPSNQFDPSTPVSSNEFDWQFFLVIGVGFGICFVAAVAPLIFSDKVNLWARNEGLCGPPLMKSCTNSNKSPIPAPTNESDPSAPSSSNEFDWQFFLVIGVGFGTGFVAVVAPLIFSNKVNLCHVVLVAGQCQGDQQSLLLQLKSSLNFKENQSVHLVKWSQDTDCCKWSGVDCDVGGRVIGLNLSNESISGGIENSTGLFSLQYLQRLNLAFNGFGHIEIPSRLANLTDLTYLNLSNAGFVGQIPIAISSMTRLVTLDLSSQTFLGSVLLKLETPNLKVLVQNLTVLKELYLDGVNISANGSEWCQALSSMTNLQVLSLSTCFLSGPIDPALVSLRLLSEIRLDQNNLSTPVPDFFADFSNLKSLRFSSCGLNGKFPEKIFQVQTLETLDLSYNKLLRGSVPQFLTNNSLRILMLRDTNFSGNTLPNSIGNLKHLSRIELAGCNFTGTIPTSMSDLTELVYLDLSANNFSGQIPSFHMSKNLTYLDLSRNVLTGGISSTKWEWLQNLVYVQGTWPMLQIVDLASNYFSGTLPGYCLTTWRAMMFDEDEAQSNFKHLRFEFLGNEGLCGPPSATNCTDSNKSQPSASHSSNEFDWQFILMGIGFGIGSGLVVAPIMFSNKVNRCCDNHIDKILMVILPMVGLVYTNSHQRRIQAEEFLENENTDEDEEEDYEFEPETEEFRGQYCVLCSKLDITRKKVIHDPNCTCHDSPPTSFSSTTSSSSSSLAVLR